MAIFGLTDEYKTKIEKSNTTSTSILHKSDTDISPISKNISGYKWEVDYYNVIADSSDYVGDVDFTLSNVVYNYNKINNAILIVDSPIENNVAKDITGSATINLDIVPRNGDFFLAKLLDGRLGVFKLTSVNKNIYNKEYIYKIEYILLTIVESTEDPLLNNVHSKVNNDFFYNKTDKPDTSKLITSDELEIKELSFSRIDELLSIYNTVITSDFKYTTSYSYANGVIIDPYLESFVKSVIGIENLDRFTILGLELREKSILDLLLGSANLYTINRYLTISNINNGVNPKINITTSYGIHHRVKLTNALSDIVDKEFDSIYSDVSESTYIFSSSFYNTLFNMTDTDIVLNKLETLVLKSIRGISISKDDLNSIFIKLVDDTYKNKLYYIPILIYLYKYLLDTYMGLEK